MGKRKHHFTEQRISLSEIKKKHISKGVSQNMSSIPIIDIDKIALEVDMNIGHLFEETKDFTSPQINTTSSSNEVVATHGYISSAISLVTLSEGCRDYLTGDGYVFTALFCFRTYLEQIIKLSLKSYGVSTKWPGTKGHDLKFLWELLKPRISPFDEIALNVENVIGEIDNVDKASTSFRYPYKLNELYPKSDGSPICKNVNLKAMKKTMIQMYRFFEGINHLATDVEYATINKRNSPTRR